MFANFKQVDVALQIISIQHFRIATINKVTNMKTLKLHFYIFIFIISDTPK